MGIVTMKHLITATTFKLLGKMGYQLRKKTLVIDMNWSNVSRFLYFQRVYNQITNIEGDIVECGVRGGRSLLNLAYLIADEGKERTLWGFDSFEGLPQPSQHDTRTKGLPKKGAMKTDIARAKNRFKNNGLAGTFSESNLKLVKGFFNNSLPQWDGKIALLHIDADLYDSYRTVLGELYSKVTPGGVVMFDEYCGPEDHRNWPGAKKAIDEYFSESLSSIILDEKTGKAYMIKNC